MFLYSESTPLFKMTNGKLEKNNNNNAYAVPVLVYSFRLIKWTEIDLEEIKR